MQTYLFVCVKFVEVKPMAQLVKDYDFGFPLKNVEQLDNIERNILTDDKYATSLVNICFVFILFLFLNFVFIFS